MSQLEKIEASLKAFALSYPEAYEDHPWGQCAFKVAGKVFVFMGGKKGISVSFTVKLPHSAELVLSLPFTKRASFGLGDHGWITAKIEPDDEVSLDMLHAWIDESYLAVAPKRLLAQAEPESGQPKWTFKTTP